MFTHVSGRAAELLSKSATTCPGRRGRYLTEGTGAARAGSDRRHHHLSRPHRQALSWRWLGAQRCGRSVCPFVPIPAVMVLMTLTGRKPFGRHAARISHCSEAHRHESNPCSGGRREQNDASAGDQSSQSQRQQGSQHGQWHIETAELHRVYPPARRRTTTQRLCSRPRSLAWGKSGNSCAARSKRPAKTATARRKQRP
jgi:hypothetical protein